MYENQAQQMKDRAVGANFSANEKVATPQTTDTPLSMNVREMDEALARLDGLTGALLDRLYLVLAQVPEADRAIAGRGPSVAPILQVFDEAISRINAASDRLDTMIARLVV